MKRVRTCVGCKTRDQASNLVRIVQKAEALALDYRKTEPGRGAWLHLNGNCLSLALSRKSFGRALKSKEAIDSSGLVESIERAEKMLEKK